MAAVATLPARMPVGSGLDLSASDARPAWSTSVARALCDDCGVVVREPQAVVYAHERGILGPRR
jgi:hypothetical protein